MSKVSTEEEVTEVIISEVHNKRYIMAAGAPICQEPFTTDFGHMSMTLAAQEVLAGTYYHNCLDQAIADILSEIATTHVLTMDSTSSMTIMSQEWQSYWKKADERTSSSKSGLHFRHYKASSRSEYLAHFHVAKTTTALALGLAYPHWQRGVIVMLTRYVMQWQA